MIDLCPEPGCCRPRGHAERTHRHVRFPMGKQPLQWESIEWPIHGRLVVIDQRNEPVRRK